MILWLLIVIPLLAAPLAWWAERWSSAASRWITLAALTSDALLSLWFWVFPYACDAAEHGRWLCETRTNWIPQWGITLHLGLDGLSAVLLALTPAIGLVAVIASWTEIRERVGFFHFNLLLALSGVIGVLVALDLFLFFLFWEVMLLPVTLLIAVWGHEHRRHAAFQFFLFTQGGGLCLLVSIIALAFIHQGATGSLSFDYDDFLRLTISPDAGRWLMLGFFIGFVVKLPAVPFHTWLPDAYEKAPTGASILLAGALQIPAAYGLLRFLLPFFPDAAREAAPIVIGLGAVGILYGAVLAFAQTDYKRLVAYSSVSHLGFVLIGIFAMNGLALQGAVMQLIAQGITSAALFMLAGALQERLHTRDMRCMGGLWASMPRLASIALFFAVAALGLPGLGNFIGEFLVLFGSFGAYPLETALASTGMVMAAIYSLALIQRTFHGPLRVEQKLPDLSGVPFAVLVSMMAILVLLGWYPMVLFSTTEPILPFLTYLDPSTPAASPLQPNGRLSTSIFQAIPSLSQASVR